MPVCVRLEVQGHLAVDDIVAALEDAGAIDPKVEPKTGDTGEGVSSYFYIHFEDPDPAAPVRQRHVFGFHANPSSEAIDGWTCLQIGADGSGRGRAFCERVGALAGGVLYDNSSGERFNLEPAPRPTMGF